MNPCLRVVPGQSLFDPTLHVAGKTYINVRNFDVVMSMLLHPLHNNLHLGMTLTTNHLQFQNIQTTKTTHHTLTTAPPTSGSLGSLGKISPSLNITPILPDGLITPSHITNINLMMNNLPSIPRSPLTAYSLDKHSRSQGNHPNRSGSAHSRASTIPPGHMAINLKEGSREEWARQVKYALTHPGRMPAASDLDANELPQPSTTIVQEHFDDAMTELTNVDDRIPSDISKRAIHLLSSTGILQDIDFPSCYVRELPQTGMLALVMPLPDISRFQMPPPFWRQNSRHTCTWPWYDPQYRTVDPYGGQDQTSKLVLQ